MESGPKRKRNTHHSNNNNSNTNNNNTSGSGANNCVDVTAAVAAATASVVDENNMFLSEENITSKDEPWAALNDSLDTSTELVDQSQMGNTYERETFVVNINDGSSIAVLDTSQSMKNIEHVYCTMVKATNDFKRMLNDMKQSFERRIEVLQKERDAAVSAMRVQVHADIDDPNISGSLHGNEIISAKKVCFDTTDRANYPIDILLIFLIFSNSAPTVTAKHWPSAHCAERRRTARSSASGRIGMLTRWSAQGIHKRQRSRSCC